MAEYLSLLEKISDPVLAGVLNTLPTLSPADKKEVMMGMLDLLKDAYSTIEKLQYTRRTTSKPSRKEKARSFPDRPHSLNFERMKPFRVKASDYVGVRQEPPLDGPQ